MILTHVSIGIGVQTTACGYLHFSWSTPSLNNGKPADIPSELVLLDKLCGETCLCCGLSAITLILALLVKKSSVIGATRFRALVRAPALCRLCEPGTRRIFPFRRSDRRTSLCAQHLKKSEI